MTKVRAVLLGLGRIGWILEDDPLREKPATHAGALAGRADAVLVGGCDPQDDRRKAFGDRFGVPVFSDARDLLAHTRPDLAVIAAETEAHEPLLRACLDFPVKAVVCEKPLTPSVRKAEKLIRLARRRGVPILVNHERRYAADYRAVRDLIEDQRLGALLSLTGRLYFGRTRDLDSMLWHDGCHLLDIIAFLLDRPDLKYRLVRRTPDNLLVSALAGSILVTVEAGRSRDHLVFELELSFERGRARIGNGVYEIWESRESPLYTGYRSLMRVASEWVGTTGYFSRMMEDAVLCARGEKAAPDSSAETELGTLKALERLTRKSL